MNHGRLSVALAMRAALFTSLAAVLACGNGPTEGPDAFGDPGAALVRDDEALLQTDSLSYTVRADPDGYRVDIGAMFTNGTGASVYFANCNSLIVPSLEKLEGGEWVPAWYPVLPLCLSVPVEVPPGDTYDMDVQVFGGFPGNNQYPKFRVSDVEGIYRLVLHEAYSYYEMDGESNESLSERWRISNRFRLVLEGE